METGIGFSEIIVIVMLCLVFFGSKEIPQVLRMISKVLAKVKYYSNTAKNEIHSLINTTDYTVQDDSLYVKKIKANTLYQSKIEKVDKNELEVLSSKVLSNVKKHPHYLNASSILIQTDAYKQNITERLVEDMITNGKRVVIAVRSPQNSGIEYKEVTGVRTDVDNVALVSNDLKSFVKSDIQLALCTAVAFDKNGTRLYSDRGSIEHALHELKGLIPIVGVAFDCQISNDALPCDARDIKVTDIVTENGFLMSA